MDSAFAPTHLMLVLFYYEKDFMLSLSHENKANIIEAFNSKSRCFDNISNIDNKYLEQMVYKINPKELQLNTLVPASILYKSIAGRYRPVSYPDGPITARYRFIKNAYWGTSETETLFFSVLNLLISNGSNKF